jgi:hypothetical protein
VSPFSRFLALAFVVGAAVSARAVSPVPVPDLDHTDLHRFARSCTPNNARAALEAVPAAARKSEINRMDRDGYTPLAHAAEVGCLEIVTFLVEAGAVVDAAEKHSRWTPLHRAAQGRHAEVVRYLLAHGADVNATAVRGQTPWTEAVRGPLVRSGPEGDLKKTLQVLLENGANVQAFDQQQRLKLEALEEDRKRMSGEIERLRDEVRSLNATLNEIRSRLGNHEPGPYK